MATRMRDNGLTPANASKDPKREQRQRRPLNVASRGQVNDLPWVHEPVRIQCAFNALHDADRLETKLLDEELLFAKSNAMFALGSIRFCFCYQGRVESLTVHVPSISSARSTMSCTHFSTASRSFGSVLSYKMLS